MPRCQVSSPIKRPSRACRVCVIIDRSMLICRRFARAVLEALVRVAPARIQHSQPWERRKVHEMMSLARPACVPQECLSLLRWHNQNRTFCSLQNPVNYAAGEKIVKNSAVVRPKNDQVDTIIFYLSQ